MAYYIVLYLRWFSLFSYTVMVQEDLNVRRVCFVITQKAGPLFLHSRLFQLPQVHSRQVCLYTYICRQIHTWAYLTINWIWVLFVGTNELHLLRQCLCGVSCQMTQNYRVNHQWCLSWTIAFYVLVNPYIFLLQ